MSRPTFITIDLAALNANFQRIRKLAPKQQIMAMVKANAYGHGLVRVAQTLTQAHALGVASLDEGLILREAGIKQPIVLMEGLFSAEELPIAAQQNFTLVVHHEPQIRWLLESDFSHQFSIWIKINTGMHRLGFPPEDVSHVYERLVKKVKHPIGLMTHFAQADNIHQDLTAKQIALFSAITQAFPGPHSLANSAGILSWPTSLGDWVRPGLLLYGASPLPHQTGLDIQLQPVMTFSSELIAVLSVTKDSQVGYGGTWTAPRNTRIGVVGVGYGDGYPQYAQMNTPVWINGRECPLVGRVSMDMLTIDLGPDAQEQPGEKVILWGKHLPVERVAKSCQSSPWELLTRMTPRPKVRVT